MNCDEIREQFADFLTGELEDAAKSAVDDHIAGCAACGEELRRLTEIWTKLGVLPAEQPTPALRERFYTMLEAYKVGLEAEKAAVAPDKALGISWRHGWLKRPAFRFAAALALIGIGLAGGYAISGARGQIADLHREVNDLRQMTAVSLLHQASPSERIRGIDLSSQIEEPENKILAALLDALNNDPSVNVQLAAVDALYLFSSYPEVKEGVLQSLTTQKSPIIQTALIDLLVDIRERRAVEAFKSLIKNERLLPEVKKRAEAGIQKLSL
jgi:predicted anti-sigma-YlaC factor YlaD